MKSTQNNNGTFTHEMTHREFTDIFLRNSPLTGILNIGDTVRVFTESKNLYIEGHVNHAFGPINNLFCGHEI